MEPRPVSLGALRSEHGRRHRLGGEGGPGEKPWRHPGRPAGGPENSRGRSPPLSRNSAGGLLPRGKQLGAFDPGAQAAVSRHRLRLFEKGRKDWRPPPSDPSNLEISGETRSSNGGEISERGRLLLEQRYVCLEGF